MQLRTQPLPLASITGKFGRRRRDNPDDPTHFICPVCSNGAESISHFLLECEGYQSDRQCLFDELGHIAPEKWGDLNSLSVEDRACNMLSDIVWGDDGKVVADLIAPFVYKCWQHRISIVHPPAHSNANLHSAERRVVDGSDAMV